MLLIVLQVQFKSSLEVSSGRGYVDPLSMCRVITTGSIPAISQATSKQTDVHLPAISKSKKRRQQRRKTINNLLLRAQKGDLYHREVCNIQKLPIRIPLAIVRRPISLIVTGDGDHHQKFRRHLLCLCYRVRPLRVITPVGTFLHQFLARVTQLRWCSTIRK